MDFSVRWLGIFLLAGCGILLQAQQNAQTRIPEHLLICYSNESLSQPENRLPMTIKTFIDIVRKVENYQKGTVDMTSLATSMLHRFRLDGVERNPEIKPSPGIIPYSVSGTPFFKHRLVLKYLVPNNQYIFPNESLTQVEACTLHFMLSHFLDKTQRGDEPVTCGRLSNYAESKRRGRLIPRNIRLRRQVEQDEAEDSPIVYPKSEEMLPVIPEEKTPSSPNNVSLDKIDSEEEINSFTENVESDVNNNMNITVSQNETSQENDTVNNENLGDAFEVINDSNMQNDTKSGKFIFNDEFNENIETNYQSPRKAILQYTTNNPYTFDNSRPSPRQVVQTYVSECPVEYGVVKTDWGSVSMGTVLAGIVAGLFQQDVSIQTLIKGGTKLKTLPDAILGESVDNRYAVTLSGDLSEVALVQGPKLGNGMQVGTIGGWNSTVRPKWYFDRRNDNNEITDAEIRGGIDGLVMAMNVKQWKESVSGGGLKLSQLLSMYYSEEGAFGTTNRACNRRDLFPKVASNSFLKEESYKFATVLELQMMNVASIDDSHIRTFTEDAANKLSSYVPGMIDNLCLTDNEAAVKPYTNVTIVIDRNTEYEKIKDILYYLISNLNLEKLGSRVTIIDGKNGAPFLVNSLTTLDLDSNFTREMYNSHDTGMDIPKLLEQPLLRSMEDLLKEEENLKLGGARSSIVLFILKDVPTFSNNDMTIAKEKLHHFRNYLPDVRFLYLAPGNKDIYKELVDDYMNDIYQISYDQIDVLIPSIVDPVIRRIKQIPIRLINPTCGSSWNSKQYSGAEFMHYVKPRGVNYHRLHPNYMWGVGSAEIKVRGSSYGEIKVCFSRKNAYPGNKTNEDTCKQLRNDEMSIALNNPCEGLDYISQCYPLYISVSSITVEQYGCSDCPTPAYLEYKITNNGLGCAAGASRFISSSFFVTIAAIGILLLRNLFG